MILPLPKNTRLWLLPLWLVAATPATSEEGDLPALEIDREASRIAADVKATGHRFEAVVTDYEIELQWDTQNQAISSARLEFDFADVKTGRSRRDREMLEWVDHESFPKAGFVLSEIKTTEDGRLARGKLSLHGVDQDMEFPVSIEEGGEHVRIRARTTMDHRDWDLEEIRAMLFMTVDPVLTIEIDLVAALP